MASEKITNFIEKIKTLSVLELSELVDAIQSEFGLTNVAVAAPIADVNTAETVKTEFDVILASFGNSKMAVIKAVKEVLSLGLKEAKEFVEAAPKALKKGISETEANELKAKFENVGAIIEIK